MIVQKKSISEEGSISLCGFILRVIMIVAIIGSFIWSAVTIKQAAENYNYKKVQHER